jgi:hypothetical protein
MRRISRYDDPHIGFPNQAMDRELVRRLNEFCAPRCDRFAYLKSYLEEYRIPFSVSPLDNSKFIIIKYKPENYSGDYYLKILIAHYDRKEDTPGANDNSAAVFQLLTLARFLAAREIRKHNVQIILSDQEETSSSRHYHEQGTYKLGKGLRELNVSNCVFFNFDMCGSGDTLILSEAGEMLLESRRKTNTKVYAGMKSLRVYTESLLESIKQGRYLALRTPFSDNLGLILQGYPTMQICVLPHEEACRYRNHLSALKKHMKSIKGRMDKAGSQLIKQKYRAMQPLTWRMRHTPDDTVERLSPEAFKLMGILLKKLIYLQIPLK